ncbi:MAG: hypothetical protein JST22_13975 [Bacteroidetes bacterium]|nr:hypothetical protein [Bacteroidota bacterium]
MPRSLMGPATIVLGCLVAACSSNQNKPLDYKLITGSLWKYADGYYHGYMASFNDSGGWKLEKDFRIKYRDSVVGAIVRYDDYGTFLGSESSPRRIFIRSADGKTESEYVYLGPHNVCDTCR